jgi:hypothetical protein
LKLNGKHQLVIYAGDVNILGRNIHIIKERTEALVVVFEENELAVRVDEAKYVAMSQDQKAGRSQNIKIDNISFEMVELLKYLRTNLMNENSIQEESKSRSKKWEFLLSLGTESFVFQSAVHKHKDDDIQKYNFACCFVWM